MKNLVLVTLIHLVCYNISFSQQNADFFEFGIRTSRFIESDFLEKSTYRELLSDPSIEIGGYVPSLTGKNYAAKLRYGKGLSKKVHFITEIGFAIKNEQVTCFCHLCGKTSIPGTVAKIKSFDIGTGFRYQFLEWNKLLLSVDGVVSYAFSITKSGARSLGCYLNPVIEYQLTPRLNINTKFGVEQSFGRYNKKERFLELGVNYR